jgi:HEAT repeat protein
MSQPDLIQTLLDAVAFGDDEKAEETAQACAGQHRLLPALRALLTDADDDRRWWAVRTLALIGSGQAAPLLVAKLADRDAAVQCAAALGLGELRFEAAVPELVGRLADPSDWVRDCASDALAMIGDAAVPALVEAMRDPRDGLRVRAAAALRRIALVGGKPGLGGRPGQGLHIHSLRGQAIGALFRGLQDPNYLVHEHSYDALERLGLLDNLIVM